MDTLGIITILLIVANLLVSYQGFKDHAFLSRYAFDVDGILIRKEYQRLFTSGFLHVGWVHLGFNMVSLYLFSDHLITYIGGIKFCLVYAASLLGGNLLSLAIHRNHGDYTAVGASGAVCGVIFASIAVIPGIEIGLLGFGIYFPGWLYGILFVLYSVYGIKSQRDNIGHDAHLGGALVGMLTAIALFPYSFAYTYKGVLAISILSAVMIYFIMARPEFLLIDNYFFNRRRNNYTIEDRYNAEKQGKQAEIDRILEKVHRLGMAGLTKKERELLDNYSRKGK